MKNKKAPVMAAIMMMGSLLIAGMAAGEDYNEHEEWSLFKRKLDVAPVNNDLYKKECGSCHFAYQPGLLPAESWKKVMDTLDNHFGANAELVTEDGQTIYAYLAANAAEKSNYKVSVKILNSTGGDRPVAITKTPYFVHKHREVPAKMVAGNPLVKSFSHCARCHAGADKGSYNEHQVSIPGYGRFDD